MGFEGFHQNICENGHYWQGPARFLEAEDEICDDCGAPVAWFNEVNDTNCQGYNYIPPDILKKNCLVRERKVEQCNLGHNHIVEEEVYRIPTPEETRRMQHWYPRYWDGPCVPMGASKIYLDDERPTPAGWIGCRWPDEVIGLLQSMNVTEISLDHDLGDDDRGTGYDVLLWIEEQVATQGFKPPKMNVHSANTSARQKMEAAIKQIEKLAAPEKSE